MFIMVFFFKQKTAYEVRISDWSSDVCSSDLPYAEVVKKKTPWGSNVSAVRYKCVDQFTRRWEWKDFYGGLSAENVTSGVCRDLMAAGMVRVEGAGYPVILTVHDEIVSERQDNTGSLDEFVALMLGLVAWGSEERRGG